MSDLIAETAFGIANEARTGPKASAVTAHSMANGTADSPSALLALGALGGICSGNEIDPRTVIGLRLR